jgi:hypothetical protein
VCTFICVVLWIFPPSPIPLSYFSNDTLSIHVIFISSDIIWSLLLCTHKPWLKYNLSLSNNTVLKLDKKPFFLYPLQDLSSYCSQFLIFIITCCIRKCDYHASPLYITGKPSVRISVITEWMDGWVDKSSVDKMLLLSIK